MPIYAYKCKACEHKFEKLQRISDSPLTDCPDCKQPQLKKMITAAAFHLKGTGWYETDFKDKKSTEAKSGKIDKAVDNSKSAPEKKASTKTETQSKPSEPSKSDSKDAT